MYVMPFTGKKKPEIIILFIILLGLGLVVCRLLCTMCMNLTFSQDLKTWKEIQFSFLSSTSELALTNVICISFVLRLYTAREFQLNKYVTLLTSYVKLGSE